MWRAIVKIALVATAVQPGSVSGQSASCRMICKKYSKLELKSKCESRCSSCQGEKKCISDKARKDKDEETKPGADKAKEAITACLGIATSKEKKQCFKREGDKLPKPGDDATAEERRKAYANLKKYRDGVDDAERESKKQQMKSSLFDRIKKGESKAAIESSKRAMCAACVEGIDETEAGSGKVNGIEKKFVQKLCVEKCVKRTILDVEASDLKACYENAATDQSKKACFCVAKDDDDVRKKVSEAKEAGKTKGVMEFMCNAYTKCSEDDEVDCEEKLGKLLSMAKGQCSGKQRIRTKVGELKRMCRKKQVDDAYGKCKEALGSNAKAKNVRECVEDATGLAKGKVRKLRQDALKKQFREEMGTCVRCSALSAEVGSAEDCPDAAECNRIVKAALFKVLGSQCEGNFKALVGDAAAGEDAGKDAAGEDELVDVAIKACEIIIKFKKGSGQCRPSGRMREELKNKLAEDGSKVDGVMGIVDDTKVAQVEMDEDGETSQMGTIELAMSANPEPEPESSASTRAERIQQRCDMIVTRLLDLKNGGGRRLADLVETDIEDVTGTQATKTCLASDPTCQSVEDDDEDDDDDDVDDGSTSTTEVAMSTMSTTEANSTTDASQQGSINNAGSFGLSALVASIAMSIVDLD